ncbi:serine carboxypeptidase 1-like isoform X2 [Carex rostrata]
MALSVSSVFSFFLLVTLPLLTLAVPESALITYLPGFSGTFPSKHYSGYITVDEVNGRNLFYYFVVSEGNPAKDPVVLWLNGGPGCSSFDGFVYEHGPFNFELGGSTGSLPKLHLNPYSWSKVSNMIYVDSPAGVGLSYSKNTSDYDTGDLKTATDSHTFLLKWFQLYPEFQQNPFYIAGESYAGVYVPTLSYEVAKGIQRGDKPTLNFKGYMVGNGVCDTVYDGNALVPFVHGMGLISDDLFQEVNNACKGSYWNPVSDGCENSLNKVDSEISGLNIYDILEPCYHGSEIREVAQKSNLPLSFRRLGETNRPMPVRKRIFGRAWPLRAPVRDGRVPSWNELGSRVPCMSDEVASTWLNNEAVRSAIHAQPVASIGEWELCTGKLDFHHDAGSMIKYHKNLTLLGYRALIYRYTQGYAHSISFLTVKGAGHTVPEYKPQEALAFYTRWLTGQKI